MKQRLINLIIHTKTWILLALLLIASEISLFLANYFFPNNIDNNTNLFIILFVTAVMLITVFHTKDKYTGSLK